MLRLLIDEDVHGDIVDGLRRRQPALDLAQFQSMTAIVSQRISRVL